jgi:acrylyl-CoA reductase (NADPH)
MLPNRFRACVVDAESPGRYGGRITDVETSQLPPGEVTLRVEYSSANYKDALACGGHSGVVKTLPHIPGIDAAGTVVASTVPQFTAGAKVLITGYELGAGCWGGWAELVRVPADWVIPLPVGLSLREAMILGTAGFTAAQSVQALQRAEITPDRGPVVVTGATGGVGCLAVMLLSKLGYRVAAVTGKVEQHAWLQSLGATEILPREAVYDDSDRPLLKPRWAGAIDTVGGRTLGTLLRSLEHRGCVAACGLVGGMDLPITVYPFILRGVKLDGIDSAQCPGDKRREIWKLLANRWKLDGLERVAHEFRLDDVGDVVRQMLAGRSIGRPLIRIV